ncbi:MAG: site-specific DNA-methyltransferase [Bacteroidetes bacterium]|nr:site-specific DNA-methyltransferase [Bacteroidota bacterium]
MINNKSPRNRTVTINQNELDKYSANLIRLDKKVPAAKIKNKIINQDLFEAIEFLPSKFIDLLLIDPPYNLDKSFNKLRFKEMPVEEYSEWIDSFLSRLVRCLNPNATVYFCGDWKSSASIYSVLEKYFIVRNRITWEREKGRGSKKNWKNNSEDIWFCTLSDDYIFNFEDVKLKRKVIAPYRLGNGEPKDWQEDGFRLTFPSNIWTDISVPFWSMSENTEHPTQKPEKLIAKLILASTNPGQIVFDPFLGSGTTAVVAKKIGRNFSGVEIDKTYSCLAEKRLEAAEKNKLIQGYDGKVFWERNTFTLQNKG